MSEPRRYKSIREIEKTFLPKCFQKRVLSEIEDPQAIGKRMAEETFEKIKNNFCKLSEI